MYTDIHPLMRLVLVTDRRHDSLIENRTPGKLALRAQTVPGVCLFSDSLHLRLLLFLRKPRIKGHPSV